MTAAACTAGVVKWAASWPPASRRLKRAWQAFISPVVAARPSRCVRSPLRRGLKRPVPLGELFGHPGAGGGELGSFGAIWRQGAPLGRRARPASPEQSDRGVRIVGHPAVHAGPVGDQRVTSRDTSRRLQAPASTLAQACTLCRGPTVGACGSAARVPLTGSPATVGVRVGALRRDVLEAHGRPAAVVSGEEQEDRVLNKRPFGMG